jgi:hypothetical protein
LPSGPSSEPTSRGRARLASSSQRRACPVGSASGRARSRRGDLSNRGLRHTRRGSDGGRRRGTQRNRAERDRSRRRARESPRLRRALWPTEFRHDTPPGEPPGSSESKSLADRAPIDVRSAAFAVTEDDVAVAPATGDCVHGLPLDLRARMHAPPAGDAACGIEAPGISTDLAGANGVVLDEAIDDNVLIDRRIRRDRRDDSTTWLVTVSLRSSLSRVHDSCGCCEARATGNRRACLRAIVGA